MYNRIKELCDEKKISPSRLAVTLGFSKNLFGELKSGRAKSLSMDKINKIADYFDVSPQYLVFGETEKSANDVGLSENRRKLIQFVETVPDDKAELVLRVMKSILEDD